MFAGRDSQVAGRFRPRLALLVEAPEHPPRARPCDPRQATCDNRVLSSTRRSQTRSQRWTTAVAVSVTG